MRKFFCFTYLLILMQWPLYIRAQVSIPAADSILQLYRAGSSNSKHPTVFFNYDDIHRIKQGISAGEPYYLMAYRQLAREAEDVLNTPLLEYYLDNAKLRVPSIHRFAVQVPSLVMMYHLSGETKYAQRAWDQIELMGRYPDWGANRHFLDAGIGAFNLALIYDGLYDYLDTEKRKRLSQIAEQQVITEGFSQMQYRKWWHTIANNWNGICNGGLIMLSLAIFENNPARYSAIISKASEQIPVYLKTFEPDGQSEEGVMYWGYGLNYTLLCFEALQRKLGTTFGLAQTPAIKKTGWFPIQMSGPVVGLSIGDDPLKEDKAGTYLWFSKFYRDTALAVIQYRQSMANKKLAWHDIIHYDQGMAGTSDAGIFAPLKQYIRGIEYMSLRSGWDSKAMFIGMHGGSNNASHGHLDAGSFDLQAFGKTWAFGSLGRDDYTYPGYFTKESFPGYLESNQPQDTACRWHFFRMRAESKNVIVVNPDTRPDQDPMGKAEVDMASASDRQLRFTLNLQPCYHRDLSAYTRTISLNNKKKIIRITDMIDAKLPAEVWWSMFTRARIDIQTGGQSVILSEGEESIVIRLVKGTGAYFRVLPADYLPNQSFPLTKNSPNTGFQRLAIHLSQTKSANIEVEIKSHKKSR